MAKKKKKGATIAKSSKKTSGTLKALTGTITKTSNPKLKSSVGVMTQAFKPGFTAPANLNTTAQDLINNATFKSSTEVDFSKVSNETTIFFDHDQAKTSANIIQDCSEMIDRDNKEIKSILEDLNGFWRGSLEERFVTQLEEYIEKNNLYKENLIDSYEQLQNGSKAYSDFDDYFVTKEI